MSKIEYITITGTDGNPKTVPAVQFHLSRTQQFLVVGMQSLEGYSVDSVEGVELKPIGQLQEVMTAFRLTVAGCLKHVNWNFSKYPNPLVVMITDHREKAEEVEA